MQNMANTVYKNITREVLAMHENYMVCNCKQVSYFDISSALEDNKNFDDVLKAFDSVQAVTHCSTGCGGCYEKVLDVIADIMSGK
jgi:NAD(P)H-nitrite reductase large subunit